MNTLRDRPVLAMSMDERHREAVVWCAWAVAASGSARLEVVGEAGCLSPSTAEAALASAVAVAQPDRTGLSAAVQIAAQERPAMVVADWPAPALRRDVFGFVSSLDVPAVFVRWPLKARIGRVLIPTGGGANTLGQLWVANEIATRYGCPTQVLHVVQDGIMQIRASVEPARAVALADVQARAMGVAGDVEVIAATDVVSGIAESARPDDLIVIGAPNSWRMPAHFDRSIPDQVARRLPNPLLMLLGRRPCRPRLREVFWPPLIRLGLRPRTKDEAIGMLVDALIENQQLPAAWREFLLARAFAREAVMSTGVGSETAMPHITLPHFGGVVGCLGICPEGVDFGDGDGRTTRFVFLLVAPEDFSEEYLAVIAKIADHLVLPAVRQELLACQTPADVLDVLEPIDEAAVSRPASLDRRRSNP